MRVEELRRAVADYLPEGGTEAGYHRRLLALLEDLDDPWRRDRYTPGHLTASAFVLHPSMPALALVHHAKLGMWVQPGGHVEADDPGHEEAARREVAEECGIDRMSTVGLIDVDIHVFPARGDQPQHLHFDLRWAFRSAEADLLAGDGTTAVRWVSLKEAQAMDESIARPARKLLTLAGSE